ncbi:hypothetical protein CYMTET_39054, partial [Cymbomonas tetramitiformis]
EQADNVTRPKYADLFEKYNYNKRPLCIPETLYDGEVDVCTFQQNPDAEDLTLGDEDTLGDLMEGDDELAEAPILSSPAAFSNASDGTPSTTPVETGGARHSGTPVTPFPLTDLSSENPDADPAPAANPAPEANPAPAANPRARKKPCSAEETLLPARTLLPYSPPPPPPRRSCRSTPTHWWGKPNG